MTIDLDTTLGESLNKLGEHINKLALQTALQVIKATIDEIHAGGVGGIDNLQQILDDLQAAIPPNPVSINAASSTPAWTAREYEPFSFVTSDGSVWYNSAAVTADNAPGDSELWVYFAGSTADGMLLNPGTTGLPTNVGEALRSRAAIVKPAAEWASDNETVLNFLQPGHESEDLNKMKLGDGENLWNGLGYFTSGDGHDEVTLTHPAPTSATSGPVLLTAGLAVTSLSGQDLRDGKFITIDAESNAIDVTFDSGLLPGMSFLLRVRNADNPVTVQRRVVDDLTLPGDTTNASATVSMTSTTGIAVGDEVFGDGIPASTTVLSIDPGVSVTLSEDAEATASDVELLFVGPKGALNGLESDVALKVGWSLVIIEAAAFGVDATVSGDIDEGFGEMPWVIETADFALGPQHYGRAIFCNKAAGTQTITVDEPVNLGVRPGVRCEVHFPASAGASAVVFSAANSAVFDKPTTDTNGVIKGGAATLTASPLDNATWRLTGNMIPV